MPDHKPMIALTFDDGPSEYTPAILDEFKRFGCHATFCDEGSKAEKYPEALRRTVQEGHDLVCHAWSHPDLTKLDDTSLRHEVADSVAILEKLTGYTIKGMRPPYGSHNQQVDELCRELGLHVMTWTFSTDDWDHNNADKTFASVKANAADGCIVLCHDRSSTAKAVSMMVPWLIEQGYDVVSVRELLERNGAAPKPGQLLTHVKDAL